MKRRLIEATIIIVIIMAMVAVVANTSRSIQLQQIDLRTTEQKLETTEQLLDEYDKELKEAKGDAKKLKQLERKHKRIEAENKRLQAELQAKRENIRKDAQSPAYASSEAPASTVAGCDSVRSLLAKHGIGGAELEAAVQLAMNESGCNSSSANSSSGACNLFQELPCGKWGGTTNVDAHIVGAIGRINSTYNGSWQYALSQFYARSPHWW